MRTPDLRPGTRRAHPPAAAAGSACVEAVRVEQEEQEQVRKTGRSALGGSVRECVHAVGRLRGVTV